MKGYAYACVIFNGVSLFHFLGTAVGITLSFSDESGKTGAEKFAYKSTHFSLFLINLFFLLFPWPVPREKSFLDLIVRFREQVETEDMCVVRSWQCETHKEWIWNLANAKTCSFDIYIYGQTNRHNREKAVERVWKKGQKQRKRPMNEK